MVKPDISGALGTLRAHFAPDISGALDTEKVNGFMYSAGHEQTAI